MCGVWGRLVCIWRWDETRRMFVATTWKPLCSRRVVRRFTMPVAKAEQCQWPGHLPAAALISMVFVVVTQCLRLSMSSGDVWCELHYVLWNYIRETCRFFFFSCERNVCQNASCSVSSESYIGNACDLSVYFIFSICITTPSIVPSVRIYMPPCQLTCAPADKAASTEDKLINTLSDISMLQSLFRQLDGRTPRATLGDSGNGAHLCIGFWFVRIAFYSCCRAVFIKWKSYYNKKHFAYGQQ